MAFMELSDSELEVMRVLWRKGEAMPFGELFAELTRSSGKDWKKQTLNTFLFRMRRKKLLEVIECGSRKQYAPVLTEEEYKLAESRAFLGKNFQGSIVKMVAAFGGGEQLRSEEIDELRYLLEEWEKQGYEQ